MVYYCIIEPKDANHSSPNHMCSYKGGKLLIKGANQ